MAVIRTEKEIWDENSTALALVEKRDDSAQLALARLTDSDFSALLESVKKQQERQQAILKNLLVDGEDFGKLPHEKENKDARPFLRESGAEKMRLVSKLVPEHLITVTFSDGVTRPPFEFLSVCKLHYGSHDGPVVGEGVGSCHPWEVKYRYIMSQRKCPTCGTENVRKGKGKDGKPDYWYCWRKEGGCGESFVLDDKRITSQTEIGKRENPDLWDKYHTCLSMAKKRSAVDATTETTASSGMFSKEHKLEEEEEDPSSDTVARAVQGQQTSVVQRREAENRPATATPLQREQKQWKEGKATLAQVESRYPRVDVQAVIFRPDGAKAETEVEWDTAWNAIRQRYNSLDPALRTLTPEELNFLRGKVGINGWTDEVLDALLLANLGIGITGIPADGPRGKDSVVKNLEVLLSKLFRYEEFGLSFASDDIREDESGSAPFEAEQIPFEERAERTTALSGALDLKQLATDTPTNEWKRALSAQNAGTLAVNLDDWNTFAKSQPGSWSLTGIDGLISEHLQCAPWELTTEAAQVCVGIFNRFSSLDFGQERIAGADKLDQKGCQEAMKALNLTIGRVETRTGPNNAASLNDIRGAIRIQLRSMTL